MARGGSTPAAFARLAMVRAEKMPDLQGLHTLSLEGFERGIELRFNKRMGCRYRGGRPDRDRDLPTIRVGPAANATVFITPGRWDIRVSRPGSPPLPAGTVEVPRQLRLTWNGATSQFE